MAITGDIIIGCFQSIGEITKFIFSRRKPQVIFAAPQHFNRDANGKNPYFEKFIECCKSHGISYIKIESPEYNCPQPHDPTSIRIDLLFWLMMLLRKFYLRIYKNKSRKADKMVAKTINLITFGKFKAPCYITMAGLFIEMFQEMCPNSKVCDLQHGIIYAGHSGYFNGQGNLSSSLNAPNCKILVWGEKFRNLFLESCKDDNISERIKVAGYPLEQTKMTEVKTNPKIILFSLEFTSDHDLNRLTELKRMLEDALSELSLLNYCIKLKHHPRFNNAIDISDIFEKYPNVELTTQALDELALECFLHITWSSTTVFEYASFGVPSYILSNEKNLLATNIYYHQFKYPVFKGQSITEVIRIIRNFNKYEEISKIVKEWYAQIYSPFREDVVLSILN